MSRTPIKEGQRKFIAGCIIGMLAGFAAFLFFYGETQEKQINKIRELQAGIHLLEEQKKALIDAEERKNTELEKKLTVQEIRISISGRKPDKATRTELEHQVAEELHSLINQSIASVADNRELIVKAIEKKPFTFADIVYHFHVRHIVIYSSLSIEIDISGSEDKSR
ncbi:sporulation membrane protein YtrI [Sporolactobacillus sp. Y61]|uniref:Sporulation membrane protein YtrI n=1 Tax=Sporolactobacillus sp. Y61 TaxID=3160863 RepID=A0AAU8IES7_9BACL|nr:sporulation membrane protein YtrI [Sporolactobacillus sp. THM19-2]RYL94598.1 hypothetical protein EWH91_01005 [Sporolactobacillus sp. THM19-2]